MNGITQPFRKVRVIYASFLFRIFVIHQFLQLIVIQIRICPEVFQYIFYCNKPIEVLVKCQKSFSNRFKAIREFFL